MRDLLSGVRERVRTPTGRKAIKYSLVSVIAVCVAQVAFAVAYAAFEWTGRASAVFATAVGTVPSYVLNRRWTWGKSGPSHVWRELVPFWVIAFVGLAFSMWTSGVADSYVRRADHGALVEKLIVNGAYFAAFAVLWVGKFVLFNKVLFVTRDEDVQAALGNEVVG